MQTIARLHNHSVDLKRVPPKSRPTALSKDCSFAKSGPQGLRRPRFSFFRFTCQRARRTNVPNLMQSAIDTSAPDRLRVRSPPNIVEELQRHVIAPRRRRTVRSLYAPSPRIVNPARKRVKTRMSRPPQCGKTRPERGRPAQAGHTCQDKGLPPLIPGPWAALPPQCRHFVSARDRGCYPDFACRNIDAQSPGDA